MHMGREAIEKRIKKSGRLELLKLDNRVGVWTGKKRLPTLFAKKQVLVRAKATRFQGGYNEYYIGDINKKLAGRRTISKSEYKKLAKIYARNKEI